MGTHLTECAFVDVDTNKVSHEQYGACLSEIRFGLNLYINETFKLKIVV